MGTGTARGFQESLSQTNQERFRWEREEGAIMSPLTDSLLKVNSSKKNLYTRQLLKERELAFALYLHCPCKIKSPLFSESVVNLEKHKKSRDFPP